MIAPVRVQRRRTAGWKMPENTVYVGRPTWFGNPFKPENFWDAGYSGNLATAIAACVQGYRQWLTSARVTHDWRSPSHFKEWLEACRADRIQSIASLRGKNLACWCPLTDKDGKPVPCHADVLLELANAPHPYAARRAG